MKAVKSLSMAEYLKADGISQSRLKAMARSPAHFKAAIEAEEEETRATIIGTLFHTSVLESHLFRTAYWLRPETYENKKGENKKWNGNATECKDWIEAHKDREVLLHSEHEAIIGMRKAVMEHPAANMAMKEGLAEQCLFINDPETDILLKCRCDWLSGNSIVDLKSTDDASPEGFAKSVAKFGYDVQAAYNLDLATWLGLRKEYFLFIAVEKEAPFAVAVYELDRESIQVGRQKYRRWLSLLSHCMEYNEWPAYDTRIIPLSLPQWSIRQEQNLLLAS